MLLDILIYTDYHLYQSKTLSHFEEHFALDRRLRQKIHPLHFARPQSNFSLALLQRYSSQAYYLYHHTVPVQPEAEEGIDLNCWIVDYYMPFLINLSPAVKFLSSICPHFIIVSNKWYFAPSYTENIREKKNKK
jgi:hypothetical protein